MLKHISISFTCLALTACGGSDETTLLQLFADMDDDGSPDMDNDGDGHTVNEGDCDDNDENSYPDAAEIFGDGVDQNCDGRDGNGNWCNLGDGRRTDVSEDCLDCLCYCFTIASEWPQGTTGGCTGFLYLKCLIDGNVICEYVSGEGWQHVP